MIVIRIRPTMYPKTNCKNVMFPEYAIAGVPMIVSVEVSVATIENASAHHGALRPPRK